MGDAADSTSLSYWLNWRVGLCSLVLLIGLVIAAILIWIYEGKKKSKSDSKEADGFLYEDEAWITCLKQIHPAWLLGFRLIVFLLLLSLLTVDIAFTGSHIVYFYTEWTFTLLTIYFGLATVFSIYGVYICRHRVGGRGPHSPSLDAHRGAYAPVPPTVVETADTLRISNGLHAHEEPLVRKKAGFWGYLFQILFHTVAGAVVLTDIVFWLILYLPAASKINLNFMIVSMHSFNFVFLLGDTMLNGMRFPMFRIAYFLLLTVIYITFQWIVHAIEPMWWPYDIIDLSNPYAPLWYLLVGLMLFPCYGLFGLIFKLKHCCLSRFFSESYQGST